MLDPVFSFTAPSEVFSASVASSGSVWALGMITGRTALFSKSHEGAINLSYASGSVRALDFSGDGSHFLTGDASGGLYITDAETQRNTWSHKKAHNDRIECVRFLSPTTVVAGDLDGRIKVWDSRTNKLVHSYRPEDDYCSDIAVVDSSHFVASHGNGVVSVFTTGSSKRKQYYKQEDDDFVSVTYCPFAEYVMTASSKPRIYVSRYPSLDFVCEAPGNTRSPIVTLRVFPGAQSRVAMAQEDGSICVSDIAPNRPIHAFRAHKELLRGAEMAGNFMLTWDAKKSVCMWDLTELSQREAEKRKRKKGQKRKQNTIRVAEKEDDFFKDY